jgi:hypothetical protein
VVTRALERVTNSFSSEFRPVRWIRDVGHRLLRKRMQSTQELQPIRKWLVKRDIERAPRQRLSGPSR